GVLNRGSKDKERKVESKVEDIETQNFELDHRVTKLNAENNNSKQTYKQLFDSIKSSRVQSKEQCDDLINQVNLKSVEVADLNASLQEKVLVITALKEQLKGKAVLPQAVSLNPIDPALLQVDVVHLKGKIATATIVPPREPIPIVQSTDKPVDTLVYTRKPKAKNVVQIVLWYLDSGCSKHMTGDRSQLINFVQKFLGTVKFGNDHVAKIMGYGDYQIGNVTISRVYYVEGSGSSFSPTYLLYSQS
nr:integrase, catalytic region, zinc finger, CCHC-type, peptidase aspartic, catalytic [Tanacetum cinerariifolium]